MPTLAVTAGLCALAISVVLGMPSTADVSALQHLYSGAAAVVGSMFLAAMTLVDGL
jgi:hypothetical protein